MNVGQLIDPLLLALFLALDIGLFLLAVRRPWVALVALLGLLPFSGLITQVLPVGLDLAGPSRLVLAAWRDAIVGGLAVAALWALVRAPSRRPTRTEWLVGLVLLIGVVYIVVSPVLLTALYVYRVLYEPPLVLASVLMLGRLRGVPEWLPTRAMQAFIGSVTVASLFTWVQVYGLRYRYLQTFYTDPGDPYPPLVPRDRRQPAPGHRHPHLAERVRRGPGHRPGHAPDARPVAHAGLAAQQPCGDLWPGPAPDVLPERDAVVRRGHPRHPDPAPGAPPDAGPHQRGAPPAVPLVADHRPGRRRAGHGHPRVHHVGRPDPRRGDRVRRRALRRRPDRVGPCRDHDPRRPSARPRAGHGRTQGLSVRRGGPGGTGS